MTLLKKKAEAIFEKLKRGKNSRKFERSMRQIQIREQKIGIARDLMLGHHLGEYKLQTDELKDVSPASAGSNIVPIEALVAIHKKYRG
jgi:hypothetical protein